MCIGVRCVLLCTCVRHAGGSVLRPVAGQNGSGLETLDQQQGTGYLKRESPSGPLLPYASSQPPTHAGRTRRVFTAEAVERCGWKGELGGACISCSEMQVSCQPCSNRGQKAELLPTYDACSFSRPFPVLNLGSKPGLMRRRGQKAKGTILFPLVMESHIHGFFFFF